MKIRHYVITGLLLAGVAAGGYYLNRNRLAKQRKQAEINAQSPDRLYTVKRDDLVIGIRLSGNVNTKVKHKLSLNVPRSTKLLAVVEENAFVSKGDLVARFETDDLVNKINTLQEELSNREKDMLILREERAILVSTNDADLRKAEDSVATALSAYNKFRKLEGPRSKESQDQKVNSSYQSLLEARSNFQTAYDNLYKPTDVPQDENAQKALQTAYDNASKSLKSAESGYKDSVLDRKIFKRYNYPTSIKNVRDTLEQARLDLKKVLVSNQSKLTQKDNQIFNAERNIQRIQHDLEENLWCLARMQLIAPADGFVTYGDPDRRWGQVEVKVGMDIYRGQVLITIPDMSQMEINTNIPEVFRTRIKQGDKVFITPDSIPNLKIDGTVSQIAKLPVSRIPWDPYSEKIFPTSIEFQTNDTRIVSGMSVQVEVVSQVLKDVISVPEEAVEEKSGKFFVYRNDAGRPVIVDVELGESNGSYVEIKSGLEPGQEVYLYRPFQLDKTN